VETWQVASKFFHKSNYNELLISIRALLLCSSFFSSYKLSWKSIVMNCSIFNGPIENLLKRRFVLLWESWWWQFWTTVHAAVNNSEPFSFWRAVISHQLRDLYFWIETTFSRMEDLGIEEPQLLITLIESYFYFVLCMNMNTVPILVRFCVTQKKFARFRCFFFLLLKHTLYIWWWPVGRNMLWNKAERINIQNWRSCTRTDENQNSIQIYTYWSLISVPYFFIKHKQ
jgi:hypothetical protein